MDSGAEYRKYRTMIIFLTKTTGQVPVLVAVEKVIDILQQVWIFDI